MADLVCGEQWRRGQLRPQARHEAPCSRCSCGPTGPQAPARRLCKPRSRLRAAQQGTRSARQAAPPNPLPGTPAQVRGTRNSLCRSRCRWAVGRRPCPSAGLAARRPTLARGGPGASRRTQPFRSSDEGTVRTAVLPPDHRAAPQTLPLPTATPCAQPPGLISGLATPWIATRGCPCRGKRRSTRRTRCGRGAREGAGAGGAAAAAASCRSWRQHRALTMLS